MPSWHFEIFATGWDYFVTIYMKTLCNFRHSVLDVALYWLKAESVKHNGDARIAVRAIHTF